MQSKPSVRLFDRTTPPHILTLILLAGVSALNMSIFLPSLSTMAKDFDTSYGTMQLAVSGYLASTAIVQLVIGPLSDRFGRRATSMGSIILFLFATLGALFSQSIEAFLIFRILQAGIASGMVLSRVVVRDIYPQDEAASRISYVTMGMALVPMLGPMIGGLLEQTFGWRSSFVFLVLSGLALLALVQSDMGETVRGGGLSFSEQFQSYPALLTSPRFWGYSLSASFGSGAFFAYLGGGSFVADTVFGLSSAMTGVALGAPALGYLVGNFISGKFTVRVGINLMALTGMLIASSGMGLSLLLGLMGITNAWIFFCFCITLGLGNGMMLPNVTAGMLSVRPLLAGTASGLGGAMMIGGGAALSQVAGAWLTIESGALPLQWIMFITSTLSVAAILFVIYRTRSLEA